MNFSARLIKLMNKKSLRQKDLITLCKVSKGTASAWWNGISEPKGKNLICLSKVLKCDPDWLLTGKGNSDLSGNIAHIPNVESYNSAKNYFPLISWVQAGDWSSIVELPVEDYTYYPCPVACSKKTFVLKVKGVSMSPIFNDGELIFVDPEKEPTNGKYIIARLDDQNEATFKQLIIEDEHKFLKPANPNWPEQFISINGNCSVVGVVVFAGRIF